MHFNTHKTFSTPHGGGGPGAGPVGVRAHLVPFLPSPRVVREDDGDVPPRDAGRAARPRSAGCAASSAAAAVLVRAYAYIRAHGGSGPARGERRRGARRELPASTACGEAYEIPFDRACKHEFVASAAALKAATGVRTLDVAKRLIDKGFHPPTIYFPLTVEEGMLIEPTETESLETLDAFADALLEIAARGATTSRRSSRRAPHDAPGPPPGRGDGRPPAQPALAGHDRRPDALPGLSRDPFVRNPTRVRIEPRGENGRMFSTRERR